MSKVTKQAIEQINKISRQLLSRILSMQNKALENTVMISESRGDESNSNELLTEHALTELMSQRETLIKSLFKENPTSDITQEHILLNEMVSLDNELSSESKACKQILAKQVIRLKKSKKVSKSYQKY